MLDTDGLSNIPTLLIGGFFATNDPKRLWPFDSKLCVVVGLFDV